MRPLADRIRSVAPSATLAITAQAAELRREGRDVLSFSAGEPDFPTPPHIIEAIARALAEGRTRYCPAGGIPELRAAIADKLRRDGNVPGVTPEQVVVTTGAKQVLYGAFQVLIEPGDEVLVPAPCWVSYPAQVRLAGGVPVFVPSRAADGFAPTAESLAERVTERTRAIIYSSPSNPSGAVFPRAALEAIAALALAHDLVIVADEIYEPLVFGDAKHHSIAALGPEVAARTLTVNGFSKAYAMTGLRLGYAAGPAPIVAALIKLNGHQTSNATSVVQYGGVAALSDERGDLARMRVAFDRRRQLMIAALNRLPKVRCAEPFGAFYAFPDVSAWFGHAVDGVPIENDLAFCQAALDAAGVALVPGSAFESPAHVRLSYACDDATIQTGLARLSEWLTRGA